MIGYKNITFVFTALIITALTGCSQPAPKKSTIMTPMGEQQTGVRYDDGYLKNAMHEYLQYHNAPLFSQYDFTKKDLNEDGILDGLVYMKTPYGRWCDHSGCTLLILKGHTQGFSIVGDIRPIRPPFNITNQETNGWKNIKVQVSGNTEKAHSRILFFNGEQYTQSDAIEPYMSQGSYNETGISP